MVPKSNGLRSRCAWTTYVQTTLVLFVLGVVCARPSFALEREQEKILNFFSQRNLDRVIAPLSEGDTSIVRTLYLNLIRQSWTGVFAKPYMSDANAAYREHLIRRLRTTYENFPASYKKALLPYPLRDGYELDIDALVGFLNGFSTQSTAEGKTTRVTYRSNFDQEVFLKKRTSDGSFERPEILTKEEQTAQAGAIYLLTSLNYYLDALFSAWAEGEDLERLNEGKDPDRDPIVAPLLDANFQHTLSQLADIGQLSMFVKRVPLYCNGGECRNDLYERLIHVLGGFESRLEAAQPLHGILDLVESKAISDEALDRALGLSITLNQKSDRLGAQLGDLFKKLSEADQEVLSAGFLSEKAAADLLFSKIESGERAGRLTDVEKAMIVAVIIRHAAINRAVGQSLAPMMEALLMPPPERLPEEPGQSYLERQLRSALDQIELPNPDTGEYQPGYQPTLQFVLDAAQSDRIINADHFDLTWWEQLYNSTKYDLVAGAGVLSAYYAAMTLWPGQAGLFPLLNEQSLLMDEVSASVDGRALARARLLTQEQRHARQVGQLERAAARPPRERRLGTGLFGRRSVHSAADVERIVRATENTGVMQPQKKALEYFFKNDQVRATFTAYAGFGETHLYDEALEARYHLTALYDQVVLAQTELARFESTHLATGALESLEVAQREDYQLLLRARSQHLHALMEARQRAVSDGVKLWRTLSGDQFHQFLTETLEHNHFLGTLEARVAAATGRSDGVLVSRALRLQSRLGLADLKGSQGIVSKLDEALRAKEARDFTKIECTSELPL